MSCRSLVTVVAGAALTLTACGTGSLSAEEVATKAEEALEQEVGVRPDISCPEELAQEEGASTRCTLTAGDDPTEYGVTVTFTATDGDGSLRVLVDDEPQG